MFGTRYWGVRTWGGRFWGHRTVVAPSVPGHYWGPRHYGRRYWGARYFPGVYTTPIPAATDLIEAIVRFGRTDGELVAAFPDKSPSNRAFIFGQSNPDPPMPRCVVTVVGDTPPLENTGRGVVYTTLVQFSVFAGNTDQSRRLARLVRNKFRRQPLSFQDGYYLWAKPHVPRPMPPEQGPGTSFIYQTVVEVMYTVGNAYGPAVA